MKRNKRVMRGKKLRDKKVKRWKKLREGKTEELLEIKREEGLKEIISK